MADLLMKAQVSEVSNLHEDLLDPARVIMGLNAIRKTKGERVSP